MNLLALMMQPVEGGHADSIAATFGVDAPHLAAQVISFAIVCALLYRLAYKPVLAMLETRRLQIAQGLANTEKINAALAAVEATRQEVLAGAREDAARLVARARRRGSDRTGAARRRARRAEAVLPADQTPRRRPHRDRRQRGPARRAGADRDRTGAGAALRLRRDRDVRHGSVAHRRGARAGR